MRDEWCGSQAFRDVQSLGSRFDFYADLVQHMIFGTSLTMALPGGRRAQLKVDNSVRSAWITLMSSKPFFPHLRSVEYPMGSKEFEFTYLIYQIERPSLKSLQFSCLCNDGIDQHRRLMTSMLLALPDKCPYLTELVLGQPDYDATICASYAATHLSYSALEKLLPDIFRSCTRLHVVRMSLALRSATFLSLAQLPDLTYLEFAISTNTDIGLSTPTFDPLFPVLQTLGLSVQAAAQASHVLRQISSKNLESISVYFVNRVEDIRSCATLFGDAARHKHLRELIVMNDWRNPSAASAVPFAEVPHLIHSLLDLPHLSRLLLPDNSFTQGSDAEYRALLQACPSLTELRIYPLPSVSLATFKEVIRRASDATSVANVVLDPDSRWTEMDVPAEPVSTKLETLIVARIPANNVPICAKVVAAAFPNLTYISHVVKEIAPGLYNEDYESELQAFREFELLCLSELDNRRFE
jgi:hypothetical protein